MTKTKGAKRGPKKGAKYNKRKYSCWRLDDFPTEIRVRFTAMAKIIGRDSVDLVVEAIREWCVNHSSDIKYILEEEAHAIVEFERLAKERKSNKGKSKEESLDDLEELDETY